MRSEKKEHKHTKQQQQHQRQKPVVNSSLNSLCSPIVHIVGLNHDKCSNDGVVLLAQTTLNDSPLPFSVTKYGNHQFSALCKKVAREAIEVFSSYITTF